MAHFRGSIQGARGEASRLGGKQSGLTTYAASWEGAIRTTLYFSEKHDCDCARIEMVQHCGRGASALIYDGPIGEFAPNHEAPLSWQG